MKAHLRFAALALALALAFVIYARALHAPFLFDDLHTVEENPSIHDLSNVWWVLMGSRRPVVNFSYALNYAVSGTAPFGYHLTNLLLHTVNVSLLFVFAGHAWRDARARLGVRVDERQTLAVQVAAAALFAAHPMMTESVAYVSARAGLLCALFSLVSLLWVRRWLASRSRAWLFAGLGALVLAAASKETAAMMPLVFLAYDRWLFPTAPVERRRRLVRFYAPLLALILAGAVVRAASYLRLERGAGASGGLAHLATQLGVFWRYVALMVVPASQSAVHSVPVVQSAADPIPWLAGAGLAAVSIAVYVQRARWPVLAFGWTMWLLLLAPTMGVPLLEHMAEHRVYEASVGLFLVFGAGAGVLWELLPGARKVAAFVVALAIAGALAVSAHGRVALWVHPVALWKDAVKKAPHVWAPHYALADVYRRAGLCDLAVPEYRAAIQLFDGEPRAHVNLAICLAGGRRFDEARAELNAALQIDPRAATVRNDLGVLELQSNHVDRAREKFLEAIELDPKYLKPRLYLALAYRALGAQADAVRTCSEARALFPASPEAAHCTADALPPSGRVPGNLERP